MKKITILLLAAIICLCSMSARADDREDAVALVIFMVMLRNKARTIAAACGGVNATRWAPAVQGFQTAWPRRTPPQYVPSLRPVRSVATAPPVSSSFQ